MIEKILHAISILGWTLNANIKIHNTYLASKQLHHQPRLSECLSAIAQSLTCGLHFQMEMAWDVVCNRVWIHSV